MPRLFPFFVSWYKEIDFVHSKTKSDQDPTNISVYNFEVKKYGEGKSYHVRYNRQNKIVFVPNYKPLNASEKSPQNEIPRDGDYIFVILWDEKKQKPQLRIRHGGSHYFLANMKETVLAAGKIVLKDRSIEKITDDSGGFHVPYNELKSEEEKKSYRFSFKRALKAVRLPADKFEPHITIVESPPQSPPPPKILGLSTRI